jgi:WD40 repeat protein
MTKMSERPKKIAGTSRAWKPDGKRLFDLPLALVSCLSLLALTGCSNPQRVGDVLDPVAVLKGPPNDAVLKLAVSPDGKYVAAKLYDRKNVYVWDVGQKKLVHRLSLHDGGGVNFTPDGKYLYTGDSISERDISLVINEKDARGHFLPYGGEWRYRKRKPEEQFKGYRWDLKTGAKANTYFRANDGESWVCTLYDMRFNADGSRYITRTNTGLHICDTGTTKPIQFIPFPWLDARGEPRGEDSGKPYLGLIKAFAVVPDWKTALLAVVRHYPPDKKEERQGKDWPMQELVLAWFDLQTGEIVREVMLTPRLPVSYEAWSMTLSPDGQLATVNSWAIISSDRVSKIVEAYSKRQAQRVFDTRNGRLIHELVIGHVRKSSVFIPDNTKLIVGGDRITAWNIRTGEKIDVFDDSARYMRQRSSNYMQMALSADGCTLAAGGENTVIYVWAVRGCNRNMRATN